MSKLTFISLFLISIITAYQVEASEKTENPSQRSTKEQKLVKICFLEWGKFGGQKLPDKGMIPDLVSQVLIHAGYKVQVDIIPWKRCVHEAKNHTYDLVASAWETELHSKNFSYIKTLTIDKVNFISLKSSKYKSKLKLEPLFESIKGERVGLVRSDGYPEVFMKRKSRYRVDWLNSLEQSMQMLFHRRVDLILADPLIVFDTLDNLNNLDKDEIQILEPPVISNNNSTMIAKTHPNRAEITETFNKSYKILVKNGFLQKIIKKHNSPNVSFLK